MFQNYHNHKQYTNVLVSDSICTTQEYAKRAKELGHSILSSCEHGWQGRYIETYEVAKDTGLKFLFSTEAYWVMDRTASDSTNCHIFLAAKNERGRRALNDVLSEANLSGFYYRPRLDISLLLSLPPQDIWVTTACLAFWKYDNVVSVVEQLKNHFKENFYLEVQYHNTDKQRDLNRRILDLSKKLGIKIIMGCDSHFIYPQEEQGRTDFLLAKEIDYGDEEGWYMDYPDSKTAYSRFATQCVLSHEEIIEAMTNTNIFLEVEEYKCDIFEKNIKMPSLYPNLSQEDKNEIFRNIIQERWELIKPEIPLEKQPLYEKEIQKEVETITKTNTTDYFLGNYHTIKRGIEKGGVITLTGRGSGVSHYTNKLLGFTDVDRISALVKMYPDRFMSLTRILISASLPDIDFNLSNPEVFAEAAKEIWGEEHVFPMLKFGTMKHSAAFKMYAKSQDISFEISNAISGQIAKFEKDLSRADEDEKDSVYVEDYIDEEYLEIYRRSEIYQSIVTSWSIHPCAYLIYVGNIREEIGLMQAKDHICCVLDGKWAEDYHFLKNDFLRVAVVESIDRTFKRLNQKPFSINELLAKCPPESKAWKVYEKGCTLGINQCEKAGTSSRIQKYKPKNISELTAFIAAIRPGFKSMYKTFESKQPFSYGVPSIDNLIQTPEMPYSFIFYQEQLMALLNFTGMELGECYTIIKDISKKRTDKVLSYKDRFYKQCQEKIIELDHLSEEEAFSATKKLWQIVEDSASYSFNASHAYCVALDSLYGAYLKAYHPLEFYESFLRILSNKNDKDRMNLVKEEAYNYFKIKFSPFKLENDHREITINEDRKSINLAISSLKGFGKKIGESLYNVGRIKYDSFFDLLVALKEEKINANLICDLIKLDFFESYGNSKTLRMIYDIPYEKIYCKNAKTFTLEKIAPFKEKNIGTSATNINAKGVALKTFTILDSRQLCLNLEKAIRDLRLIDDTIREKVMAQTEIAGFSNIVTDKQEDVAKIIANKIVPLKGKNGEIWAYVLHGRSLGNGKSCRLTVQKKLYDMNPIKENDVVRVGRTEEKNGYYHLKLYFVEK